MRAFEKVKTEKQFIGVLKRYYKLWVRMGGDPVYYSFLSIVENAADPRIDHLFEKYFAVGNYWYNWQKGNSLLKELVQSWREEIQSKGKGKKSC